MNLFIGKELAETGEWVNIHESSFQQTGSFEQGTLDIPEQEVKLANGEVIKFYSIYVESTEGLVLEAEQNNVKLITLTCFLSFDVVVLSQGGCGVRFYTSA